MKKLDHEIVEAEIMKAVKDVSIILKIGAEINISCNPGNIFPSHVLLDLTPTLEIALGVTIPLKEYIFFDKSKHKQLSIKEAAEKLIKIAKYGK